MKPIGGEIHYQDDNLFQYMTDSGRSSIRLLLLSGLKNKKFLLPDFLCKVILTVFDELSVEYSFYKVQKDLSIDLNKINKYTYDVIYIINFFGMSYKKIVEDIDKEKFVIEDCVFLPVINNNSKRKKWAAFNSFRKISFLADGSLLKSTFKLSNSYIIKDNAPFSLIKYKAKKIKNDYLLYNKDKEECYLKLFEKAETIIDKQTAIYTISDISFYGLLDYYLSLKKEYRTRSENVKILHKYLSEFCIIDVQSIYLSHYVIRLNLRDELRVFLFSKNIYLPVHWPQISGIENDLYKTIISIPIDSRYNKDDMFRIAKNIENFIIKNKISRSSSEA